MAPRRERGVPISSALLLFAGCAGGSPSPQPPYPEASATVVSPVAAPGPTGRSAVDGRTTDPLSPGPLPEGDHRIAHFEPSFTVSVQGDDWTVEYVAPAGIGLLQVADNGIEEFALSVFRMDTFTSAVNPRTGEKTSAPVDFAAWLQVHPYLEVLDEPGSTSIDGRAAVQLDLVAAVDSNEMVPGSDEAGIVPLLGDEQACCFNVEAGAAYRWILFEVDGAKMWVNLIAFDGEQLDRFVDTARPTVESIHFD